MRTATVPPQNGPRAYFGTFGLRPLPTAYLPLLPGFPLVPEAGLEPARGWASGDFESPASASSATPACTRDVHEDNTGTWAPAVADQGREAVAVSGDPGEDSAHCQGIPD